MTGAGNEYKRLNDSTLASSSSAAAAAAAAAIAFL